MTALAPAPSTTASPTAPYRSTFLSGLVGKRWKILALLAMLLVSVGATLLGAEKMVRTIGYDTKASVVAAETIRTNLAQSHAAFMASFAANDGRSGPLTALAHQRIGDVMDALTDAAKNITYGTEESNPIDTILRGLTAYEADVGAAGTSGRDRLDPILAADDVMRWTLLPAAATLDRVNAEHLADAYKGREGLLVRAVLPAALLVATIVLLVMAQIDIRQRTKRQTTPLLLAATLAVAVGGAATAACLASAFAQVRVAKEDAFDSISALWNARSLAASAFADASEALLPVSPDQRRRIAERYDLTSLTVLRQRKPVSRDDPNNGRPGGLLGDEAANVTFEGEAKASADAIAAWRAFDEIERASTSRTGTAANTDAGAAAFQKVDAALAGVIGINDDAFSHAIDGAMSTVRIAMGLALGTTIVGALLAWFGITPRIREYRG